MQLKSKQYREQQLLSVNNKENMENKVLSEISNPAEQKDQALGGGGRFKLIDVAFSLLSSSWPL